MLTETIALPTLQVGTVIMMGSDTQHTDNIFYGNMDALEPGTEGLFHHVSFGRLEIASLPPMESTLATGQTDFRTVLYNFLFFSSCKYIF